MEVLFGLCWRDMSDRPKPAAVVKPIEPAEGSHSQILQIVPLVSPVNVFCFADTVNCLSEALASGLELMASIGSIIRATNAADRRFDVRFC